jgi:hypothetical protein
MEAVNYFYRDLTDFAPYNGREAGFLTDTFDTCEVLCFLTFLSWMSIYYILKKIYEAGFHMLFDQMNEITMARAVKHS